MTDFFLWAGVVSFLVMMPLSYMPWEKYALPLFMLSSLILAKELEHGYAGDKRVLSTRSFGGDLPGLHSRHEVRTALTSTKPDQ